MVLEFSELPHGRMAKKVNRNCCWSLPGNCDFTDMRYPKALTRE